MRRLIVLLALLAFAGVFGFAIAEDMKEEAAPMAKCEMVGEISVKTFPAMKVASVTEKAMAYAPEGGYKEGMEGIDMAYKSMMTDGFGKMGEWMKAGNHPMGPPCAMYFEDPEKTPAKDLSCKIMFPAADDAKATETVMLEELPAMEAASVQYKGPYEGSANIWNAMSAWVAEHGYEIASAPMEVYLKGPGDNAQPADYLTEIRMPVKKAEMAEPKE